MRRGATSPRELLLPADGDGDGQSRRAAARRLQRRGGVSRGDDRLTDPAIETTLAVADGESFDAGAVLARVHGPASGVLQAERVALNFVQRMSGIATLTAQYVALTAGTGARIVDTRKTTPGLRAFERHAVRSGGGHNHRFSLSDAVMVKDNHLAVIAAHGGLTVTEALLGLRAQLSHTTHVEVEVDGIGQIDAVLAAGVDTIMLDNFSVDELRAGCCA